jgi:hypothetical protein
MYLLFLLFLLIFYSIVFNHVIIFIIIYSIVFNHAKSVFIECLYICIKSLYHSIDLSYLRLVCCFLFEGFAYYTIYITRFCILYYIYNIIIMLVQVGLFDLRELCQQSGAE